MICFWFFPTPLIALLWSTPKKQMYKPGHIWECLEENTAGESSHEKALHMGRAKSCSEAEGQMLQSNLNYRCASLLWTTLFILLGTTWWVWMFLLLWSTEIKRLPLLELTVLLLLSILLFQQGYSSPGDTNTILSLWMRRPGWLSAFFSDLSLCPSDQCPSDISYHSWLHSFPMAARAIAYMEADVVVVFIEWCVQAGNGEGVWATST